jgi:microcystin-dependent protein
MPATTTNRGYPYPLDDDGVDIAGDIRDLAESIDLDVNATLGSLIPGGVVQLTIAATAPTGWALIQGQSYAGANTAYPELWAAAPLAWKSGTTLTLPDARGRFLVMAGGAFPLGAIGGSSSRTLSIANMPSHSHAGATASENAAHSHVAPDHLHHPGSLAPSQHNHGPGQGVAHVNYNPGNGQWLQYGAAGNLDFSTPGATDLNIQQTMGGMTGPSDRGLTTGGQNVNHQHGVYAEGGNTAFDISPAHFALNLIIRLR